MLEYHVIDTETPVLSDDCHEPGGVVTRYVYPLVLSRENLLRWWEKVQQFRSLFAYPVADFKSFCEILMSQDENGNPIANGLFWRLDDFVGVFYLTHIYEYDAQIHYAFFDRRHHGRQALVRKMIWWAFQRYGFRRLSAEVPYFAKGTFEFIEQIGLKHEGRKRKGVLFDGEWFDVRLYGILREEAERWPQSSQ